jgi:hypothetical protein
MNKRPRLFQNFSFERATTKKSGFVGRGPKNRKSFGKTNRVLQEARPFLKRIALLQAAWFVLFPVFAEQKTVRIFDIPEKIPEKYQKMEIPEINIPVSPESSDPEMEEPGNLPEISAAVFAGKDIMGKGEIGTEILSSFLLSANSGADPEFVRELAVFYTEEAEAEGVNHDIAFAQMCLETGFLRYGGLVTPEMNNFCGLGSIGPGEPGESFSSVRIGVRAHIQHLKAYATDKPLKNELVDPRRRWVRQGSAPLLKNLSGSWAADIQYSYKIGVILSRLYLFKPASE